MKPKIINSHQEKKKKKRKKRVRFVIVENRKIQKGYGKKLPTVSDGVIQIGGRKNLKLSSASKDGGKKNKKIENGSAFPLAPIGAPII